MESISANQIETKLPFDIRLGTVDDMPFIKDSWLKSMKHIYPNNYALDFSQHYQQHMQKLIDNSFTFVAHLQDDPNDILSYLIFTSFCQRQIILFAYTVAPARQQGLLNELLKFSNPDKAPVVFTHPAKNENTMQNLCKKYIFDPTILSTMELL